MEDVKKAMMKPWQRIIEQTSKMHMGWPRGRLPLLGVGKSVG